MRESVGEALRKMGTEYIDLYLLHSIGPRYTLTLTLALALALTLTLTSTCTYCTPSAPAWRRGTRLGARW